MGMLFTLVRSCKFNLLIRFYKSRFNSLGATLYFVGGTIFYWNIYIFSTMKILGISAYYHDSAAAIIEN